jgi:hypothetical protein
MSATTTLRTERLCLWRATIATHLAPPFSRSCATSKSKSPGLNTGLGARAVAPSPQTAGKQREGVPTAQDEVNAEACT